MIIIIIVIIIDYTEKPGRFFHFLDLVCE